MVSVAVIGDGLLARTIGDELMARNAEFAAFGHEQMDVGLPDTLDVLGAYDVTINTAAYHRFDECEENPLYAHVVNCDGADNVAQVSKKCIYISDALVFTDGPYAEVLPGHEPPSIYGKTKLMGEINTLKRGGIVVRVSALYGHHASHKGTQFPDMVVGGYDALRVPDDQRFAPTYAPDAATRIVDIALDPYATGIYHCANSGSASWHSFAVGIAEAAHHKRTIIPTYPKDPLYPPNSVLRSTKLPPLRHWRFALLEWAEMQIGR